VSIEAQKRLRLRVAIKLMLAFAALMIVYVFGAAFFTPDKREPNPDAMSVGVSQLRPGDTLKVNWEGRPILIHRRSAAGIAWLSQAQAGLSDAASQHSQQPGWARNAHRSRTPEWFVALAVREDAPCVLVDDRENPHGGYVSECDALRFDAAGRVFAGQTDAAVRNLRVPVYDIDAGIVTLGGRSRQ